VRVVENIVDAVDPHLDEKSLVLAAISLLEIFHGGILRRVGE